MLIDDVMPEFDFVERHARHSNLDSEAAWRSVLDFDLTRSRIARSLFFARGLGLWRKEGKGRSITFDDLIDWGFIDLGTNPGEEKLLGLIGEFWKPTGKIRRNVQPADFSNFAEPGFAKTTWNFTVSPSEAGSIVATETRIQMTDAGSVLKFRLYWRLVRPFSGLVRRRALRIICQPGE